MVQGVESVAATLKVSRSRLVLGRKNPKEFSMNMSDEEVAVLISFGGFAVGCLEYTIRD